MKLTRKQIFILLTDKDHTRDEIRDMDIEWANEIIFPERDDKGQPAFLAKLKRRTTTSKSSYDPIDQYRQVLWLQGWPAYKIDAKIAELKEQRQELLRQAGISQ